MNFLTTKAKNLERMNKKRNFNDKNETGRNISKISSLLNLDDIEIKESNITTKNLSKSKALKIKYKVSNVSSIAQNNSLDQRLDKNTANQPYLELNSFQKNEDIKLNESNKNVNLSQTNNSFQTQKILDKVENSSDFKNESSFFNTTKNFSQIDNFIQNLSKFTKIDDLIENIDCFNKIDLNVILKDNSTDLQSN